MAEKLRSFARRHEDHDGVLEATHEAINRWSFSYKFGEFHENPQLGILAFRCFQKS